MVAIRSWDRPQNGIGLQKSEKAQEDEGLEPADVGDPGCLVLMMLLFGMIGSQYLSSLLF
jgi:hypothetical protein